MTRSDPEIEELRDKVHCGVVLERAAPPWQLDRKASTKRCLKYRRGEGEIVIVSHGGRGWWEATGDARGDVFGLVQWLEPSMNFGHARKLLRELASLRPQFPLAGERPRAPSAPPSRPVAERWAKRPRLIRGSLAWNYLLVERRLPLKAIETAAAADVVREGPQASAWFAHRNGAGAVRPVDIRGPAYKGALTGGSKSLFGFPAAGGQPRPRLVLAEASIDALSLAGLEHIRPDTLYAATGGGMGPGTIAALEILLATMAALPGALFCSAADANPAGDRFALQHRALVEKFRIPFARLRPPIEGGDWNDILKQRFATKGPTP